MSSVRISRARSLRQNGGLAEKRAWSLLRCGRVDGLKFRRQHPIGVSCRRFCL
ncbi:MAG: DUF559 domain-containing protein [Caulobacterales bacterium]|nr:DUF559 domain-containing protein [Caulobacterales bacterium]